MPRDDYPALEGKSDEPLTKPKGVAWPDENGVPIERPLSVRATP